MAKTEFGGGVGIAVGADINGPDAQFSGSTPAGWALRWFLIATVFILIIGFSGARKG